MPRIVMFTLIAGLLVACGEPRVSLSAGAREYVSTDYEHVLSRWTRTEHLIALSEMDDLLTVSATFESWDFRWAYVIRYAQDYRLTTEQRRGLLDATLAETRTHHQFFVALYGSNRRWTNLTRPDSAWIVRLIDDRGSETAPEEIVAIPKPGAIERTYFPYASVWRQAFRIKFPASTPSGPTIAPDATMVGLRFAGAQGSEELRWTISTGVEHSPWTERDPVIVTGAGAGAAAGAGAGAAAGAGAGAAAGAGAGAAAGAGARAAAGAGAGAAAGAGAEAGAGAGSGY